MTQRTARTTPGDWQGYTRRLAFRTSHRAWLTGELVSGYQDRWPRMARVTLKTEDHPPTAIPTSWRKPSSGPPYWKTGAISAILDPAMFNKKLYNERETCVCDQRRKMFWTSNKAPEKTLNLIFLVFCKALIIDQGRKKENVQNLYFKQSSRKKKTYFFKSVLVFVCIIIQHDLMPNVMSIINYF